MSLPLPHEKNVASDCVNIEYITEAIDGDILYYVTIMYGADDVKLSSLEIATAIKDALQKKLGKE